jgi:hypothetical protein
MDPRVELLIGGVWTDITSDTLARDGLSVARGRPDERQRVTYSRCNLTLNNVSGKYSNRNPTSPYYGLIGRNTQLRVRNVFEYDPFTRTTASGWGTAPTGQTWTNTGGSAADFSTNGSTAAMSHAANTTLHTAVLNATHEAVTLTTAVRIGVLATGAPIAASLIAHYIDANNYYQAELSVNTDQTVQLRIWRTLAGVATVLSSSTIVPGLTHTTGTWFGLQFQISGIGNGTLRARAWDTAVGLQSTTWNIFTPWSTIPAGQIGCSSIVFAGNTNAKPVVVEFDNYGNVLDRFVGEVPQWPQRWDVSGKDVWVPLEAAGIMRRLSQGSRKVKAPIYREATKASNLQYLIGYWTCTDGSASTMAASAIGGPSMTASAGVTFASDSTSFPGSEALPVCTAGGFTVNLPAYTFSGTFAFRGLFTFGAGGLTDQAVLADTFGNGAVRRWALRYRTGGGISLHAYDQADVELGTTGPVAYAADNKKLMLGFSMTQNGANIDVATFTREVRPDGTVAQNGFSITFNALTLTPPNTLIIGNGGNLSSTTVGHFMVGNSIQLAGSIGSALAGNAGERAATRMARLCAEEGVPFVLIGNAADTAAMGPQLLGTLMEVLNDCADADGGILYEPRDRFGLAYRTRTSLYNQTGLALDYAAKHLSPPLEPIDDDQAIRNNVTATRPSGSSATATLTSGPLSTLDPPNGVGTYDDPITVNVQADTQLPDVAGWRLHIGTWDEARYPLVNVQLINPPFAASDALTAAAADVDVGDYFSIANPPSWLPPDLIEQHAQGSVERLDKVNWQIAWNGTPAGPYRVIVLDGTGNLGRLDQPGSTLTTGVNTTATALSATVPAANPLWTQSIADVPFEINLAGERIRVDSVGSVINANPWMIVDAAGWSGDGSTLAWSTAQQYNLAYGSLFVTPTAGGLPAYARSTARVAGTATVQYQIGAWIRPTTAWASGFRVGVDWYTATIGGTYISTTFHGTAVVLPANTWTYVSGVVTAPATTGGGQLFVVESGTPAVTDTWFASGITYAFIGSFNTSPQTFTCTRSINGVVKSQLSGAAIGLWHPPALAR